MPKRFTLAEAQRLVPEVDRMLRDAIRLKAAYEEAEGAMRAFGERIMMMGGLVVDREQAMKARKARGAAAERFKEAIEEIQETGCLIKDLDIGLVDFPTLFHGSEVYLCWKMGEAAIEFWHGTNEGFRGRKPINQEFLDHHQGDAPQ